MTTEVCKICSQDREAHNSSDMHHQFSEDGQLRLRERTKAPSSPRSAPDIHTLRLALVLVERGLINAEDLEWVLEPPGTMARPPGHPKSGDTRSGEGTERGLRPDTTYAPRRQPGS